MKLRAAYKVPAAVLLIGDNVAVPFEPNEKKIEAFCAIALFMGFLPLICALGNLVNKPIEKKVNDAGKKTKRGGIDIRTRSLVFFVFKKTASMAAELAR